MISELLNICLQIIEALIAFYFYESISQESKGKLKRISIIIIGYLMMCGINLAFNYNVIINNIVLLIFHFFFSLFLYKQKIPTSIFYSIMFACLITVSEIVVIDLISAATGANSRAFINDISFYSLLIVFSKSLLFFTLKIVSHIINSFKSNEKFRISLPISELSDGGSIKLKALANVETKPIFIGKAANSSNQDYAITGISYENGTGEKEIYTLEELIKRFK